MKQFCICLWSLYVRCYWHPHERTVFYNNPAGSDLGPRTAVGLKALEQTRFLSPFPDHPHASIRKGLDLFSHSKRYMSRQRLGPLPGALGKWASAGRWVSPTVSRDAISPSAAPVSARTAEAAPVCAAAWTVPRCGLGSSLKERLCYQNPLEGIFFLCSFQGILFYLLPATDTRNLYENQTLKLLSNYNAVRHLETSALHPSL